VNEVTLPQQSTPWRTAHQAAARVQCGVKQIYRAANRGELKAARIGGRKELRFRDEWIDLWLSAAAGGSIENA
jgi:excisionase family DNA binding protein